MIVVGLALQTDAPIPFAEIAAKAGAQYQGDGLSVLPSPEGARLRCVFQKLEGQATSEGLWLASTVHGAKGDRFRIDDLVPGLEYDLAAKVGEGEGGVPVVTRVQLAVESGKAKDVGDLKSKEAPGK